MRYKKRPSKRRPFLLHQKTLQNIEEFFINEQTLLQKTKPVQVMMEEQICAVLPEFEIQARPDRLEFYENEIFIIDYKVYSDVISSSSINQGLKPQLPLQAMILKKLYPGKKLRMFYYYINLSKPLNNIEKKEIFPNFLENQTNEEFAEMEKSVANLKNLLPSFFYNQNDVNFYYTHFLREEKYEDA